jgi:co-chaperonin GroES (HSP10)
MKLTKNLKTVSQTVKPLSDRVLIQRLEYAHPILAVTGVTLQKGLVVAVGPGKRQRKKIRFDLLEGHLSTSSALYFEDGGETGRTHPIHVKVGDVVEFSPRNQIDWEHEGEKLVWIRHGGIYGTSNDSRHEALLWQQSAGHDRNGNFLPGTDL